MAVTRRSQLLAFRREQRARNDGSAEAQELIDNGMAWRLEGFVGRQCMAAIEAGAAVLGPEGNRDYWGNYVPAEHEVQRGTKGSLEYALEQQERWY